jgi:hypothetical protein
MHDESLIKASNPKETFSDEFDRPHVLRELGGRDVRRQAVVLGHLPSRPLLGALALAAGALIGFAQPAAATLSFDAAVIDAGESHTCVLMNDGTVRCWGSNINGQLGYGNSTVPGKDVIGDGETPRSAGAVDFGGPTAVDLTVGRNHNCAILLGGGVRCWGWNGYGQLGYALGGGVGGVNDFVGDLETPAGFGNIDLGVNRTALKISAGSLHTCAILDNGKVRCWGWGAFGQLGYANENNVGYTTPRAVRTPARSSITTKSAAGAKADTWDTATPTTSATTRPPPALDTSTSARG